MRSTSYMHQVSLPCGADTMETQTNGSGIHLDVYILLEREDGPTVVIYERVNRVQRFISRISAAQTSRTARLARATPSALKSFFAGHE